MNIHQDIPRIDCTHMAKCGVRSIYFCRKYRSECGDCTLLKRKPKLQKGDKKICSKCGKLLSVNLFYTDKAVRNGKVYTFRRSACKLCMTNKG